MLNVFQRRTLLGGLAALVGVATVPLVPILEYVAPRRCAKAVRSLAYPGRLRPLRLSEVLRPGKWGG